MARTIAMSNPTTTSRPRVSHSTGLLKDQKVKKKIISEIKKIIIKEMRNIEKI